MVAKYKPISTKVAYLIFLGVSIIFIFLFSRGTSPFYNFYGHDSAIFITMGKALLDGKTPYVDFFDHKGPMLIFINALGQIFIEGRYGIFILQIINLSVVLLFIYKISRLFFQSLLHAGILISIFLLFFRFTITEGNLTEEYTLPFIFISIYFTFRFYFKQKKLFLYDTIILGLCFFIPFWMRPNNVGMICACLFFVAYILLKQKEYGQLTKFLCEVSLTVIIGSFLLCSYFWHIGALDEMIYSTFTFNLKYARIPDLILPKYAKHYTLFIISAVLSLCVGATFLYKKIKDENLFFFTLFSILLGILPILLTGIDRLLLHYMTLTTPVLVVGILFLMASVNETRFVQDKTSVIIIIISILLLAVSICFRYNKVKNLDNECIAVSMEIANDIPVNEQEDVFLYHAPPSFYLISGFRPFYKYFTQQEFHVNVDSTIFSDINNMVQARKPLWIITGIPALEDFDNTELRDIIKNDYYLFEEKQYDRGTLCLYRRQAGIKK